MGDGPLTEGEIRQLLRECVTVVKPGECVVLRVAGLTPQQHREYQTAVNAWHEHGTLAFRVIILVGDELGVVRADGSEITVTHHFEGQSDLDFADQLQRVMRTYNLRNASRPGG